MEECRIRDQQLENLDERIKGLFLNLPKSKRVELDIEEIKDKISEYTNAIDTLKMEFRNLPPKEKEIYKTKAKTYQTQLRNYKNEIDWNVAKNKKEDLKGGRVDVGGASSAQGRMDHGLAVQAQSDESLGRTLKVIEDTKAIGRDVAVKLEQQTTQLEKMYDDLKDTQGTLARSAAILKRMARKTLTDKYVWGVVCLVGLAILGLILWKVADPEGSAAVNVPDQLTQKRDVGFNTGIAATSANMNTLVVAVLLVSLLVSF